METKVRLVKDVPIVQPQLPILLKDVLTGKSSLNLFNFLKKKSFLEFWKKNDEFLFPK